MTNNGTNENMQHFIQHKCFYYRDDSEVLPRYSSSKYKLVSLLCGHCFKDSLKG